MLLLTKKVWVLRNTVVGFLVNKIELKEFEREVECSNVRNINGFRKQKLILF